MYTLVKKFTRNKETFHLYQATKPLMQQQFDDLRESLVKGFAGSSKVILVSKSADVSVEKGVVKVTCAPQLPPNSLKMIHSQLKEQAEENFVKIVVDDESYGMNAEEAAKKELADSKQQAKEAAEGAAEAAKTAQEWAEKAAEYAKAADVSAKAIEIKAAKDAAVKAREEAEAATKVAEEKATLAEEAEAKVKALTEPDAE